MNLEEIKQRVEGATGGSWEEDTFAVYNGCGKNDVICKEVASLEDALFIAHARQDIPDLIVEVERLEKKVLTDFFEFGELSMHCENLTDENKRLREALTFYADKNQYAEKMESNKGLCMYRQILRDRGKTARQALGSDSNE